MPRPLVLALLLVLVWLQPASGQPATLAVDILDAGTDTTTPARVRLTEASGRTAPLPDAAVGVLYGRSTVPGKFDGFAFQPDSSFYVDGSFEVELGPGRYHLIVSKGNEYLQEELQIELEAGERAVRTVRLRRWIDMTERGWYSADEHIHLQRSPRDNPHILTWTQAEDVHVGILLWMGEFFRTHYPQYAWGRAGVYREGDYLLASGQEEPRTPELGHTVNLGASEPVRFQSDYYLYDKVFDRIHELGGLTGYAHQAASFFHGHRGLTLDALRGKVDHLEIIQFCAPGGPLIVDNYYHLLDLGYPVTATAGSDFPWCGKGHRFGVENMPDDPAQIGNVRFYTYVEPPFTYERWKNGLEAGRTFVTSGPVVLLDVDGRRPGDRLEASTGDTLRVTATAFGHRRQVPLDTLEVIAHGEVLARATASAGDQSAEQLSIELAVPVKHGLWIAARASAGRLQEAHTTPVYVTVDGRGFHNPRTVSHYLDLSEQYLQEIEHVLEHQDPADEALDTQIWRYRDGLTERINETRAVIDSLRTRIE